MAEHPLISAAVELARWPEVVARLLDRHVPGRYGYCRGCSGQVRVAPPWPCRLADVAARADTIGCTERARAGALPIPGTIPGTTARRSSGPP